MTRTRRPRRLLTKLSQVTAALLAAGLGTAQAADPLTGTYNSPSLGGTVLEGRSCNSWAQAANAAKGNGDVFAASSWNGSALGTQYRFDCAQSTTPQVMTDTRNAQGTGVVLLTTFYNGGTFFLSKDGPWGDGVNDLTGTLGSTIILSTLQYVENQIVSGRENIQSSGSFDGSSCTLVFVLANGIRLGDTDTGTPPPDYPGLFDGACAATRTFGSWSDVVDISLQIDCPVPVEDTGWGTVKRLYR